MPEDLRAERDRLRVERDLYRAMHIAACDRADAFQMATIHLIDGDIDAAHEAVRSLVHD